MKRAAVDSGGPRRSKRLAHKQKSKATNSNDESRAAAVPAVVSDDSTFARRPKNKAIKPKKTRFPQDMLQQVEATLVANYYETGNSDIYEQEREPIFRILRFALSDNSFLAKDPAGRATQERLVNDLCTNFPFDPENHAFGSVGTLVEVLITRGDIVPPRSISFLLCDNDSNETTSMKESSSEEESSSLQYPPASTSSFKELLITKGHDTIDSIESLLGIIRAVLMESEPLQAIQAISSLLVFKSIVQLWLYVLEDGHWDASEHMLYEQLENVNSAFEFAQKFQVDCKAMDVKTMLLKLVLYFSFAIDWPRESCITRKERNELKRMQKIVRS